MLLFLRFHDLYGNRLVFKTIIQIHEGVMTFPVFCYYSRGCTSASCFYRRLLGCIVFHSGSRACCYCFGSIDVSGVAFTLLLLLVTPLTSYRSAQILLLLLADSRHFGDLVVIGIARDGRNYFSYPECCTWRAIFLIFLLYHELAIFLGASNLMMSRSVTH